jgi:hypothetical protein
MSLENTQELDWKKAFSASYGTIGRYAVVLLVAVYLAMAVPQALTFFLPQPFRFVVQIALSSTLACGMWHVMFAAVTDEGPALPQVFSKIGSFWKFFLANTATGIVTAIGLLFFIFPGIYLALRVCLFPLAMAEHDLGPIEAVKYSWEKTRGQVMGLFLLSLCQGTITAVICGLLAFPCGIAGALMFHDLPQKTMIPAIVGLVLPIAMLPYLVSLAEAFKQITAESGES